MWILRIVGKSNPLDDAAMVDTESLRHAAPDESHISIVHGEGVCQMKNDDNHGKIHRHDPWVHA